MEEKEYSVSEAVRLIGVESHVLRYWEEELHVPVGRSTPGTSHVFRARHCAVSTHKGVERLRNSAEGDPAAV